MSGGRLVLVTLFPLLLGATPAEPQGIAQCPGGAARSATAVTVDGPVELVRGGAARPVARGAALCPGDLLRTGEGGRVELRFVTRDTTLGLTGNSSLSLPERADAGGCNAMLGAGLLRFISSVRGLFCIGTRTANAGIDGTEAVVAVGDGPEASTLVLVREGDVTLSGRAGRSILLTAGDAGYAAAGVAPRAARVGEVPAAFRGLLLDQAGASDWAIYYPPILLGAGVESALLARAAARLEADDPDGAEALLAGVPRRGRQGAAALALRAVVALLRGREAEGAALSQAAVALDPGLGAARIAQSYALQAAGRVEEALAAARTGASLAPADAYARARLAELQLTLGRRAEARDTAAASLALRPTALGHAIAGFAALALYDDAAAMADFEAAIALEDSAPLPRLGLGLALVRQNAVAAGRRELELAASLDPRRADLRTWLGRAYFAEGLGAKAASQFALARELDPDDPLPLLFSAAERYAANAPLEAVRDLEEARALAPARAVMRGPEGLGEDRAVAAASLGRALDELGFTETALDEGARAVEEDPTNATAHRVLADLMAGYPGLTFARGSSALRAQLLSPPTLAPVQAAEAEPDLALLDQSGPARLSFGEYTPLFDRYGSAARLSAFGGTQSTWGDNLSVTHAADGYSVGFGQSYYATDGYRFNNEVDHLLFSLEGKVEVGPFLSLFGEIGYRHTDAGDRSLSFDLSQDDPFFDRRDRRSRGRIGAHIRAAPGHDVLAVATFRSQDLESDTLLPNPLFGSTELLDFQTDIDSRGLDFQLQHIGRFGDLTTTAGLSFTGIDREIDVRQETFFGEIDQRFVEDSRQLTAYGYGRYRMAFSGPLRALEATLGLSVDHLSFPGGGEVDRIVVNPKAGLRLDLAGGVSLRAAYLESLTPDLLFDQRIEPVTVAGFAQYRPEFAGAKLRQVLGGLDWRATGWLTLGGNGAWREVGERQTERFGDRAEEVEAGLYAHARLGSRLAFRLYGTHLDVTSDLAADPDDYETTVIGGELRYFDPSGIFAWTGLDYVDFSSTDNDGAGREADEFLLGTLGIGYRLPERRGVFSLELTNAFDQDVAFRERPIRALGAAAILDPVYPRGFTALARVTLAF